VAALHRLIVLAAVVVLTAGAAAALADSPLPLWQRVILGGEYEGFTPQPLPPKQLSLPAFANATKGSFTRITKPILTREMRRDGFRAPCWRI
jgi:hypothetical protein